MISWIDPMFNRPAVWVPLVAGGLSLYLFTALRSTPPAGLGGFILALASLLAALSVLWSHQLGHVLAAAIVGLKTNPIYLWPYVLDREDGWKLSTLGVRQWLNDNGPKLDSLDGARKRVAIALLGGPLVSLIVSIAAFVLVRSYPDEIFSRGGLEGVDYPFATFFWGFYFWILALLGAGYFIITILPIRDYGMFWDGAFLVDLMRGGDRARRVLGQYILEDIVHEKRPRDWPAEWLEAATDLSETSDGLAWRLRAYHYHLDRDEFEEARAQIDQAIRIAELKPSRYSGAIRMERIFLYAWLGRTDFDLQAYFDEFSKTTGDWGPRNRAQAMLHIMEGKPERSIEIATRSRDYLRENWNRGVSEMSADWFDRIIQRAFEQSPAAK